LSLEKRGREGERESVSLLLLSEEREGGEGFRDSGGKGM